MSQATLRVYLWVIHCTNLINRIKLAKFNCVLFFFFFCNVTMKMINIQSNWDFENFFQRGEQTYRFESFSRRKKWRCCHIQKLFKLHYFCVTYVVYIYHRCNVSVVFIKSFYLFQQDKITHLQILVYCACLLFFFFEYYEQGAPHFKSLFSKCFKINCW